MCDDGDDYGDGGNRLEDAKGALRRARQVAATNETLMTYLQAVLGVDSVARFLAAHAHSADALAAARQRARTETLARLGGLPALCADAAAQRTAATPAHPHCHHRHQQSAAAAAEKDDEDDEGNSSNSSSRGESERDDFRVAQEMVAMLARGAADDDEEGAAALAHNAAVRGVAPAALCQALCVWLAARPLAPGTLEAALDVAFRRPAAQRLRTREQRAAAALVRALAAEAPAHAPAGRELCAQLAVQVVADAARGCRAAHTLAHTLAALACDLALGPAPVYAAAAEVLARRAPGAAAVVCAAAAGWPEAFVPRPHDLLVPALATAICSSDAGSGGSVGTPLLARVCATCHWGPPVPAATLARVLAHPRALAAGPARRHEWVCAVCVLAARVPGFAVMLETAAAAHGEPHRALVHDVCAAAEFPR